MAPKVTADLFHQGLALQAVAKIEAGDWNGVRLDGQTSNLNMMLRLTPEAPTPMVREMLQAALATHQLSLIDPTSFDPVASRPNDFLIAASLDSPLGRGAFELIEKRGQAFADKAFDHVQFHWWKSFGPEEAGAKQRVLVQLGTDAFDHPRGVQEVVAMNGALAAKDLKVVHTLSTETQPSQWSAHDDGSVQLEVQGRFGIGSTHIKDSIRQRGERLANDAINRITDRGGIPKGEEMFAVDLHLPTDSGEPGWRGTADLDAMRVALRRSGYDLVEGGDAESRARSGPYLSLAFGHQMMIKRYTSVVDHIQKWF